jgi:DNA repair protein RadD
VFTVPRRELLKQTAETMDRYGIPYGVFSAGYTANPFAKVQLATTGTLARRLDKAPAANLLFIDETHVGGDELNRIIAHYKAQGAWLVGLSGTPMKTSGKPMGDWYDSMVQGQPIGDLIEAKRLSGYRLFAPNTPDLTGIKTVAGDYAKGQLADRMEGDRVLIGDAVRHYRENAAGLLSVAFCTSVKHADIVAQAFRDGGVPSAAINGKMDDNERGRIIAAFARGQVQVLTNCALLTYGFDLASAAKMDVTIECMSDLSPTKSLPLQLQKWGRVLRKKDKPAIILDHAGNAAFHGLPDDAREWSLAGRDVKSRGDEAKLPVRQCPNCYFVSRPQPVCPSCGFVHPVMSREVAEVDGVLQEVRRQTKEEQLEEFKRATTLEQLVAFGKKQGYKRGWAMHVYKGRMAARGAL